MQTIASKLPNVGTTIFTVMSRMAAEHGAINLSQGFPDFPVAPELIELISESMKKGYNQYAPMAGLPALREQLAEKIKNMGGVDINPDTEITVTAGATEALFGSIAAIIHPGDEVIVLEPAYDSYIPAIELAGGVPVSIPLQQPDFNINWQEVNARTNDRTRMIIINTPHNPTGTTLKAADTDALRLLLEENPNLLVLSDEVYEHIIFDGANHQSVLNDPLLQQRSIAVYSFGKTFHATGWKVGYVVAPEALSKEIRKVHQYLTFSVHTPTQVAIASYLENEAHYRNIPQFYQKKRDLFLEEIKGSGFKVIPSEGTYFQLLSYGDISDEPDQQFAERLTKTHKIASIPISVFYSEPEDNSILRFCFAKEDETLAAAGKVLRNIS